MWSAVEALVGQTLERGSGGTNAILAVDSGGVVRRTSKGRTQRIDMDVFRWTIERLLRGDTVLREEINAHSVARVSSGVTLILGSTPMFEVITEGNKLGLRMRADGVAGGPA